MRVFFVVTDLEAARTFYDLLFCQQGRISPGRLAYRVDGVKIDFYTLTAEQEGEFRLQAGPAQGCGVCLERSGWPLADLEKAGAQWLRPMGPSEWGAQVAHLRDPFGYRWELTSA